MDSNHRLDQLTKESKRLNQIASHATKVMSTQSIDSTYAVHYNPDAAAQAKVRGESSNRQRKITDGKKSKQLNGEIRAVNGLNASLNLQSEVSSGGRQPQRQSIQQNQTPSVSIGSDIYMQYDLMEGLKKPTPKAKKPPQKLASDKVLQDQIASRTLNHGLEGQNISKYLSEYQNLVMKQNSALSSHQSRTPTTSIVVQEQQPKQRNSAAQFI